jgi:citrate synthase
VSSSDAGAGPPSATSEYLSAADAAALLKVKLPTLYAYTSRGLVRSVPGERGRARRYLRADLDRLRARRDARAGHGPVAAGALRWGEPVLDSSITALSPERGPVYRGRAAVDLALADVRFEAVAELLWTGAEPAVAPDAVERTTYLWGPRGFGIPEEVLPSLVPEPMPPLPVLSLIVPLLAIRDPGRFVHRPDAVASRARTLIVRMAASLGLAAGRGGFEAALSAQGVPETLAAALGARGGDEGVRALNRALVLAADHELNASTFAARVAASTNADVYACVQAALATLSGPRHGGASERIEALVDAIGAPEDVERVVHERGRRGEAIDGFGHPLYPDGDPRARGLLELAAELGSDRARVKTCIELVEVVKRGEGGGPTLEMGLVALAEALALPPGSASGIFAVGRCAGWVAHVLEHYEAGYLLRPRARYKSPG